MIIYKVNIKYKKIITIHQGKDPNRQDGIYIKYSCYGSETSKTHVVTGCSINSDKSKMYLDR